MRPSPLSDPPLADTVHLDALLEDARSWDEFALRQRLVALHLSASALQADLGVQFPADLVPRSVIRAVTSAAEDLAHVLSDLDALHYTGLHRRRDVAQDEALCQYREDAEAVHGEAHRGLHRRRRMARMTAARRPQDHA